MSVVCSTGLAATLYGSLGAKTLHKWAGIEDGRHLDEEIVHLVQSDERFITVKKDIMSTDLLIIDEISMISAKTLHQVEVLCRNIRESLDFFGGIQIILSGDFYQLPPVENKLIGEPGNYCYKLPWFNDCFPHKIELNIIHRQSEAELIKCINNLELGNPSEETIAFLNSLDRPLPNENEATQLFARNFDVDIFNYYKIQNLPGEMKTYRATDEGSEYYLRKFLAPKNLGLKVGCKVMLVRNLSDTLVNGLCGIVCQLNNVSVDVKFEINYKFVTVTLKPVVFTTYDPVEKIFVAKRTQIPLKLAYAITVHKSQGMSLSYVVVNCEYCFQAGQIGVAVGRAVQIDGLRVKIFRKTLCRKHPPHVTDFYQNFSLGILKDDLSCCRKRKKTILQTEISENPNDFDDNITSIDNLFENIQECFQNDSDSDNEIENLEKIDLVLDRDDLLPAKVAVESVIKEFIGTPVENDILSFKDAIMRNIHPFEEWYASQLSFIEDIGLNTLPEGQKTYSAKQQHVFFCKIS